MRPAFRGLLVLVAGSVLLAGCNGGNDPAPTITPPTGIADGGVYVALGDSYTAGPRLGVTSGAQGCEQTTGNYPHLLAERLGLELTDVSCGGATSESLTKSQTPPNGTPVPPQLDAVTADADLVTLSIGGNDGRAFGTLVTTCVGLALKDRKGAPCAELGKKARDGLGSEVDGLAKRLVATVEKIRKRAPDARIVMVGYPQMFPASGTCDLLPLAAGDYPFARDLVERVVQAQQDAATEAGIDYVDVWTASEGHDICSADPWIAGLIPAERALEYHPYAEEQKVVADLLEELLSQA
ncbi:SGNH/GDSL hydrolase family protein [Pimelobacter simplex]|uniref:Putative secreted hydrolase n=1 Tax=Nocardioides simplex TaxID=2045 RepID=A0A0A1DUJ4_NOCSI|nr:SGNH/GDSL hydrolase family protein [Pimelobacter simplex]AIY19070.1 putative secreted hydrolase [Pimelobacter simplex]MCG8149064.1 SGNH/GDSL hydrolase family protein [Pimelobacter simplex]GEB14870.1 lipase [Pimelobacter simplex]SFM24110.1 GDSL-like Lipase/Acylhydrolase family protein [Pimelobacter simplex]